jgi:hypothetical protein
MYWPWLNKRTTYLFRGHQNSLQLKDPPELPESLHYLLITVLPRGILLVNTSLNRFVNGVVVAYSQ